MPSVDKVIAKLYNECLGNEDENVDASKDIQDVLEFCEQHKRLTEHEGNFFAFVRSMSGERQAVRMVYAIRQGKKKVFNVENVMKLIREIERALIYVDRTNTKEQDGFFYLDITKELPQRS